MKKIVYKRTGKVIEDPYTARALVRNVKRIWPSVQSDEHRAPHGYPTAFLAEKANLRAIIEAHDGYISVYEGNGRLRFCRRKSVVYWFQRPS